MQLTLMTNFIAIGLVLNLNFSLQFIEKTSTMNTKRKFPESLLHIPPAMWKKFHNAMLQERQAREEVMGFLFCSRQQLSKRKIRYIPQAWVVPSSDCYEHQTEVGLVLKQSFHKYLLDTYLPDLSGKSSKSDVKRQRIPNQEWDYVDNEFFNYDISDRIGNRDNSTKSNTILDVVHIHTHLGDEEPKFSYIDDRHEAEYAKFLGSFKNRKHRLISGVFNESLDKYKFRIWDRKGTYHTQIKFCNSWFAISDRLENKDQATHSISKDRDGLMFARQQVFGQEVQEKLGQLKVALIGCGGIGSVFAEQLARLGVKNWILIDPDRLETSNLNRMPGATIEMVDQCWYKVHYVKHLIKKIYQIGSHVECLANLIEDKRIQLKVADADLIVVATDNHNSRQTAQKIALKYVRPLMCLGTHIDIKPNKNLRLYCRVTIPPLGGHWCLMCGNIISLQQAALESAPNAIADIAYQAGYIQGINNPAVLWLNSICASTAVGVLHGMLSDFLNLDFGLDWIYDFPNSNWLQSDVQHLTTSDCYFCAG